MTRVFLSHARGDDEAFVWRLCSGLNDAVGPDGPLFNVWFDRVSMPSRSLTFHQEIRDAVHACDRLILVVGPKAMTSDYVTQEWHFAYYAANKCVNPIVRLDGCDPHGNKVDGYSLIPEDLKLLHAEDFRDDSRFADHLKNLVRQLSEALPPVGKLVAVPELPPGYRAQHERLKALRDLLLIDLQKPVVVTGAAARVGLQGMGGIGKSVLASALAHHPQVQRAFQDGIFWITLGQQPNIEELQRWLVVQLGGDGQFNDRYTGKEQLRQLLADVAALLILDDVWQRDHADAFNVAGTLSRILLTTRDTGLVTALAARENHYRVELPTLVEAEAILGATAEVPPDELPPEARAVIKECGRLPLALALCGGMVRGGVCWPNVLETLQDHDLEFLSSEHPDEAQHQNVWKAMDISLRVLPADEQDRFAELAVFGADAGPPDAAIATLWQHTAALLRQTEALLAKFTRRSLVQRPVAADSTAAARADLHDLLHHFATGMAVKRVGGVAAFHRLLLDAYRAKCPTGWPSGPNDGYFFQNLAAHLIEIEAWQEIEALGTDLSWLMRKCELGLLESISRDYGSLMKKVPAELRQSLEPWQAFFREEAHILRRGDSDWPAHKILLQLTLEHADDSPLTQAAEQWLAEGRCDWLWLRRLQREAHFRKDPCVAVLEGHGDSVSGALELDDGNILSWSADKTLRLWDSQSGACLAVLHGHMGRITGALVLGEGKILSWSVDQTLRLWDRRTGESLATLKGHTHIVDGALALASKRILSWSADHTLRLWDSQNGTCLAVLEGHNDHVLGALELADGRLLSWSTDKTLRLWDSQTAASITRLEGHHWTVLGALALDDGRILSWSVDGTLRLWDGQEAVCLATLKGHTGAVTGALLLRDKRLLTWASGGMGYDSVLRLWDMESGDCIATVEGHESWIAGAISLADGRLISWSGHGEQFSSLEPRMVLSDGQTGACLATFTGQADEVHGALELADRRLLTWSGYVLRLWDSESGVRLANLEGHTSIVSGALELADHRLLSWSWDGTLRIWDGRSTSYAKSLEAHGFRVTDVAVLNDGRLASWGDQTLRLWECQSGDFLKAFENAVDMWNIRALPLSDGRLVLKGNTTIWLLDNRNGDRLVRLDGHTEYIRDIKLLADGRLLSRSDDGTIRLWDLESGVCQRVFIGHKKCVEGVLELGDGRLLSWSSDATLRLWSIQDGDCLITFEGHSDRVNSAQLLRNGQLLSRSHDATMRLWNILNGGCLATFQGHTASVQDSLELSGGRLLSWGYSPDTQLRLWGIQTAMCLAVLSGHTAFVGGAMEWFDGRLLSWSDDRTLRFWDGRTGACLAVLEGHRDAVGGVLKLADGRLVSWSLDDTFRLWDSDNGVCLEAGAIDQIVRSHPDWLHALQSRLHPETVSSDFLARCSYRQRTTKLCHHNLCSIVAAWDARSASAARSLLPDGTVVVTLDDGQVCVLKLHHGNRRITLTQAEELSLPRK